MIHNYGTTQTIQKNKKKDTYVHSLYMHDETNESHKDTAAILNFSQ